MHNFRSIRNCRRCNLCENQTPLVQHSISADVFWVGLSAVKVTDRNDIPLSPVTNSGKLIESIEFFFHDKAFHKTNVVKCLPLENGKIRYPSVEEMRACYSHLKDEINSLRPRLVFLLGKQVSTFILKEKGLSEYLLSDTFDYQPYAIQNTWYVPIHHPSFILVYKRRALSGYIQAIEKLIDKRCSTFHSVRSEEEVLMPC